MSPASMHIRFSLEKDYQLLFINYQLKLRFITIPYPKG